MDYIIRQALTRWGWSENSPYVLLAERENRVYRVEPEPISAASHTTDSIVPIVLRIHRQNYRSDVELKSELQWMAYLPTIDYLYQTLSLLLLVFLVK